MDLAQTEKPDWMSDEEWERRCALLRKGRFLAEIRPTEVALVAAGANRRPWYAAKTEDTMPKTKKAAAGAALKTLLAHQQALADVVDKIKKLEADADLDDAVMAAIGKLAEGLAEMTYEPEDEPDEKTKKAIEEYQEAVKTGMVSTVVAEKLSMVTAAIAKLASGMLSPVDANATADIISSNMWKILDEAKLASVAKSEEIAIAKIDEKLAAVSALPDRLAAVEKQAADLVAEIATVQKSATDRKDELSALVDLVEQQINPTASSARA